MKICANCTKEIKPGETTGDSSLYNPGGINIILCELCWLDEDNLIEEKGRNNLPEKLNQYKKNIKDHEHYHNM